MQLTCTTTTITEEPGLHSIQNVNNHRRNKESTDRYYPMSEKENDMSLYNNSISELESVTIGSSSEKEWEVDIEKDEYSVCSGVTLCDTGYTEDDQELEEALSVDALLDDLYFELLKISKVSGNDKFKELSDRFMLMMDELNNFAELFQNNEWLKTKKDLLIQKADDVFSLFYD